MTENRYDPLGEQPRHYDMTGERQPISDDELDAVPELSTLEMLRQAADAEAAAEEENDEPPLVLVSPSGSIRIGCSRTPIPYKQLHAARKAALPRKARRAQQPDWSEMDPTIVAARLIAEQTVAIWIWSKDAYRLVADAQGVALDFTDAHLLASFSTADAQAAVRRIFGTDPHLLDAGEELLAHSGWSATGDLDDPQPTQKRSGAKR